MIALERLQASENRIQQYWDDYTHVTPYQLSLHKVDEDWDSVEPANRQKWESWRGQKIHWQQQVAFLNNELKEKYSQDTDQLVKEYGPSLLHGAAGALTHGIIHLGWAIDAESPWMITEGLAYLNFAYLGFKESTEFSYNSHSEAGPIDSYLRVARSYAEENLQENWIERVKAKYDESFHPELVPAGFQWHLAKALYEPHSVATKLPTWLHDKPLKDIMEEMYKAVVSVYLATRSPEGNGNFVILHLITSLWGLEKTLRVLDLPEEREREVLAEFYAVSVVLLSMGSSGFPSVESLEATLRNFPYSDMSPTETDWSEAVQAGIGETEEHNIKLVYVARELWRRYDRWSGFFEAAKSFTLTPEIGPAPFKA